jgi:hypothetical protein
LGEIVRICMVSGQQSEGREAQARALALDPLSPLAQYGVFCLEVLGGEPERWQSLADRALETTPYYAILRFIYGVWLVQTGRSEAARALLARAPAESPQVIASACCRFLLEALNGQRDAALACFDGDVTTAARRVEWWSFYVSWCYAFVGENDRALHWLENAIDRGFIHYPFLTRPDIPFAKLRGHARFDALLERVRHAWERFPD